MLSGTFSTLGRDYSVGGAQRALYSSMRALRTERIDYFLLHEPVGALAGAKPLADFLDANVNGE